MNENPVEPGLTPTQVVHPGRASLRTLLQSFLGTLIALSVVLPFILQAIIDSVGPILSPEWRARMVLIAAAVAAVSAAIARIMAIPQVEAVLERLGIGAKPADEQPNPRA